MQNEVKWAKEHLLLLVVAPLTAKHVLLSAFNSFSINVINITLHLKITNL